MASISDSKMYEQICWILFHSVFFSFVNLNVKQNKSEKKIKNFDQIFHDPF